VYRNPFDWNERRSAGAGQSQRFDRKAVPHNGFAGASSLVAEYKGHCLFASQLLSPVSFSARSYGSGTVQQEVPQV
jgi:hypothetical protein